MTSFAVALPRITPRPASVAGVATPLLDMNGTWEFSAGGDATFKPIQVPGEWAMQGFSVEKGAFARYRRTFELPADWVGMAIRLRFDAVHAVCRVFLNGREIGGHEGGFVPFELDATAAARPGANELIVKVQSESIADSVACMSQYASHQVGGILRKVTLFCVPQPHVSQLWHETRVTGTEASIKLHTAWSGAQAGELPITHRLLDAAGKLIATAAGGQEMRVPNARLWTSETPYLYTLETRTATQTLHQSIGLREIKVAGNQLLVNGSPVKLMGANRHEIHPLTGRSITPALCRRDAELFRAANVNLVRTSHYPPSEEFLTACDELGIFVECEAAVCWIKHSASPVWNEWDHLDRKFLPHLLQANLDNIAANRNHPSIILWSIANESLWTPLFAEVLAAVKQADPSRPATFHDQCWGDFNNAGSKADLAVYHYPDETDDDEWSKLDRPAWFGEYAHVQCYNRRELVTDPGIQADWGRPFARMVDLIWQQPGCVGGAIWSGIDDVFQMPNGELKGYGHWGIIDGWRRERPEYYQVRDAYSPIRILEELKPQGDSRRLKIQNRFNFTNLSEISLKWKTARSSATIKADIPPHATGEIELPFTTTPLVLTAIDRRGVTVARFEMAADHPDTLIHTGDVTQKVGINNGLLDLTSKSRISIPPPCPVVIPLNPDGGAKGPAGSVLSNKIEPFNPLPDDWRPTMTAESNGSVTMTGETSQASATISITPINTSLDRGVFQVRYELRMKQRIDPRQWGIVFTLPQAFDTLVWHRKAERRWHDAGQLDRPCGTAPANASDKSAGGKPGIPWALDSTALGSADFRSTKANIMSAILKAPDREFVIRSLGDHAAARAWVNGDCVRLLVAGFNTGGADTFFAPHYANERRPLKPGDTVSGAFLMNIRPAATPIK